MVSELRPLVEIRKLWVKRGNATILKGIDANIDRGKITALIGLNGSGKTTLLRTIIREYPFEGEILFFCGHDHSTHRPKQVGYVPQKLMIEPHFPLTVRELFALGLQKRPLFFGIRRKVQERIVKLLERVGGIRLLDRLVTEISGGELQRVLLALAMEPHPELLLLDEPAAGVDFADQQNFYELLADLNRETGVTILLVSHDLSIVSQHAHHVLCLKNGIIECQGAPQEMLSTQMLSQTFGVDKKLYLHQHELPQLHDHHLDEHGHSHGHHHKDCAH